MRTRLGFMAVAMVGALALFAASARAEDTTVKKEPDAKIEFKGGSVAVGIGFSWGSGTVTYKGKTYPISVDGLSVGAVGRTDVTASGVVFGLTKIEDIEGNYTSVTAGVAIGGGGMAVAMRNEKGVTIDGVGTTIGLKVALATAGVKITLKKK